LEGQVQESGVDPFPGGDDGSRFGDRAPEVDPVPEVADTCLGFTAVAMAEVFSELEKRDEEVGIRIPSSL